MKYYVTVALSALVAGCLGHMYPSSPCARGSPLGTCGYPNPDYNLMAPIATDNSPNAPLCHHAEPYASPVETVQAGSSITVVFEGSAIHNGGHCEFSLSYDGGKQFVAIQTIIKTCFLSGKTFNVPIPQDAPSGKAVFAWSWVNASGNREFYMTCSDIEIQGGKGGVLKGPQMITPNYDGNSPTIGEFGTGGGDDGSKYYKERPNIEVSGSGASSPSGGNSTSPTGTSGSYSTVSSGSGAGTASGSAPSSTLTAPEDPITPNNAGDNTTSGNSGTSAAPNVNSGNAVTSVSSYPATPAAPNVNSGNAVASVSSYPDTPATSSTPSNVNQASPSAIPSNPAQVNTGSYPESAAPVPNTPAGADNPSAVDTGAYSGSSPSAVSTPAGTGDPSIRSSDSPVGGSPSTCQAASVPIAAQA
ncbi:hypothetical protein IWQ61_003972 [Dispira simplex]|nr:hypothetical protein IWQ61_003972 [Dispira simplex]